MINIYFIKDQEMKIEPDYSRSDSTTVVVRLNSSEADIPFLRMIITEEERHIFLPNLSPNHTLTSIETRADRFQDVLRR